MTFSKVSNILRTWTKRNLSILGKINIINTLVASQFVHKMMVLPMMSKERILYYEKLFSNFLWGSAKPKISIATLQATSDCGGANLVNLLHCDYTIKSTWIQILKHDKSMQEIAYQNLSLQLREDIWKCNLKAEDIQLCFSLSFWTDVLFAWSSFNFSQVIEGNQILWYNSLIKINNKPIFWKEYYNKGLRYVSQLFTNGTPRNYKEINCIFGIGWLQYYALLAAIPYQLRNMCQNQLQEQYSWAVSCKELSRTVYHKLSH